MVRALNKTSIVFEDLFEKITSGFYQEAETVADRGDINWNL